MTVTATGARRATQPSAATPETNIDNETLVDRARRIGPTLREHAETAERERRLPKPAVDALRSAGFQKMLAPRSLGGLELDPVTCARIVEEVARHDSAAAWSLQSSNVSFWWTSRLPEEGIAEMYGNNPDAFVGAAFHPPQQAVEVPGGFRVTGRAPLASMIHEADWLVFSAFIMDDGKPRMTEFGPAMIGVHLKASEVQVLDTWYTLGMRGTDSNDAAFSEVFVPTSRTFVLTPEYERGKHFQGPLYRFPAIPIIGLFGAAVLLAAGRAAIDEFRQLAQRKVPMGTLKSLRDKGAVQTELAIAEAKLRSARAFFYETLSDAWERTSRGEAHSMEQRADLLLAGIHAAKTSAEVTDQIHRLAGTTGIYAASPLDRYFRDAHTLRHHGFVSEGKLDSVGQVYLGLPPDFMLMAF